MTRFRRPRRRFVRLVIFIIICVGLYYAVKHFNSNILGTTTYTDLPASTKVSSGNLVELKISTSLQEAVGSALEGTKGKYAIVIKNLKTSENYFQNENEVFDAGSLYKLWVMATVFKQIEEGKLTEDQVLSQSIEILNRKFGIDPELAELQEGGITQTVSLALGQMITISHNYSALLLTEKIRLSTVANFLKTNGFTLSKVGTGGDMPVTTASEMALFLEKLYNKELASEESTSKMIELLKKQKLNKKLPKYLPPGTTIAHKTGELGWFSHDAGIVYLEKGDYIIVILSESSSPAGAEERIAELSKAVYEYFSK